MSDNVLCRMYLVIPLILCKRLKNKVPVAYQAYYKLVLGLTSKKTTNNVRPTRDK